MAGKLNIKDLQKEVAYRQQKNNEVYEKILGLVHKKIIGTNEKSDDYCCIYKLPNFMYGYPIYNSHKCMEYLITKLSNNGFDIRMIDMSSIFISWRPTIKNSQTSIEYTSNHNAIQYNPNNFQPYPQITSGKKTQNQYDMTENYSTYNLQVPAIADIPYNNNNQNKFSDSNINYNGINYNGINDTNYTNYSQMTDNNIRTINPNNSNNYNRRDKDKQSKTNVQFVDINSYQPSNEIIF